jgi:IrrE N-terminal-like domain
MSSPRPFVDPLDGSIAGGPTVERDRHGTDMLAMELAAARTLDSVSEQIWDWAPPIPVEAIAEEHFGLIVIEFESPTEIPGAPQVAENVRFSGMLMADRGEIWVSAADAREWPPRKRFTIAHELGHFVLHRDSVDPAIYQAADVAATGAAPADSIRSQADPDADRILPRLEAEANAYAAALLMPARLLREAHEATGGELDELQEIFNSSRAALERRLRTLGLLTA